MAIEGNVVRKKKVSYGPDSFPNMAQIGFLIKDCFLFIKTRKEKRIKENK